jgi:uncharacterized iron-regulated protein
MTNRQRYSFLLAALMPLMACSTASRQMPVPNMPPPPWHSKFETGHPLAGRIWQPGQNRYVQKELVQRRVRAADFVLLGEQHDNIDHHLIQAWLVQSAFERGRVAPVAFEMFTTEQSRQLEKYQSDHPGDANRLGQYMRWDKSGWPAWSMYYPIAQAAMAAAAPLIAASLPRRQFRPMVKKGAKAVLGSHAFSRLGLDAEIPPAVQAAMRREIIESHCNMLSKTMVGPMVQVQRVKDASMARILIDNGLKPGGNGALLIAGIGHVRNDHGVPWHLKRAAPNKSILTIGMIEVEGGLTDPRQYGANFGAGKVPFDFVWFTPRSDDTDPCERYSRQLKKIGKPK